MYTVLTVAAALLGLLITGAAVFAAWAVLQSRKDKTEINTGTASDQSIHVFLRWSVLDYLVTGLVLVGFVFLAADLTKVLEQREAYPFHHYGYLLIGFVISLAGVLLLLARLHLLLRLAGTRPAASLQHQEAPNQANRTK